MKLQSKPKVLIRRFEVGDLVTSIYLGDDRIITVSMPEVWDAHNYLPCTSFRRRGVVK